MVNSHVGLWNRLSCMRKQFAIGPGDQVPQKTRSMLEGLTHQDVPFDRLIQRLNLDRAASRPPLFKVLVAL